MNEGLKTNEDTAKTASDPYNFSTLMEGAGKQQPPAKTAKTAEAAPAPSAETTGKGDAPQATGEVTIEPSETTSENSAGSAIAASENPDKTDGKNATIEQPDDRSAEEVGRDRAREKSRAEAGQERRDLNHEKSSAEKLFDAHKERLDQIEKELAEARGNKADLEESLDAIEYAIKENVKEHEGLSTKADELERKVKQCRRGFFSKISGLFRNAVGGRLLADSEPDLDKREADLEVALQKTREEREAKTTLRTTQEQLDKNEAESEELGEERASTVDQIQSVNKKVGRLNSEKAKLEREVEELKAMAYNEGFEEAIADAIGGKSAKGSIRALERERTNTEQAYAEHESRMQEAYDLIAKDIQQNDKSPGASNLVGRVRGAEERTGAERAGRHYEAIGGILNRSDILKNIVKTESIKGSLSRLKAKIMERIKLARMR